MFHGVDGRPLGVRRCDARRVPGERWAAITIENIFQFLFDLFYLFDLSEPPSSQTAPWPLRSEPMEVIERLGLVAANLALAEAEAIHAMAGWLATPEGQAAGDTEIALWLTERGWHPSKWRAWAERIAAQQALADPKRNDPTLIQAKLDQRLERLAFRAEGNNDLKHAIQATEAQAKLNKVGGFAPQAAPNVAIQINTNTAHLASDDDLAMIATQAPAAKDHDLWD